MSDAVVVRNATKSFGPKIAVRDLDMTVPAGAMVGFIGPNGAGKTTTIRLIMSILFPDRGEISVLGHPSALEAKDRIGYLPEERGVYKKMKVGRFLAYMGRLKGVATGDLRLRVRHWLERVGLADVEHKRCEELSKGMQQKVQFLAAVIHEPDLLILDEPFSGLDPVNQRLLRTLIDEQHRRGATIIFSTHVMAQAQQLCERLVMIHDGVKVLDDTMAGIQARYDPRTVLFEPLRADADPRPLRELPLVEAVEAIDGAWEITLREGTDVGRAIGALAGALPAARVELHRPTLEDVFIQIVAGGEAASRRETESLRAALREGAVAELEEVQGSG